MDIVSRLKQFLQQSGIANSQFADTCEIPRPTLSQLLNGRNKKVSDEVISKIHRAYPSLNMMWLMFGDGDMFVPNANTSVDAPTQMPVTSEIDFSGQAAPMPQQQSIKFGDDFVSARQPASPRQSQSFSETIESIVRSTGAARLTPSRSSSPAANERSVVNIVVFYSDGRFETFTPSGR